MEKPQKMEDNFTMEDVKETFLHLETNEERQEVLETLKNTRNAIAFQAEGHFDMSDWLITPEGSRGLFDLIDLEAEEVVEGSCGTAACLAGWAVLVNDIPLLDENTVLDNEIKVSRALGISMAMFYVERWPVAMPRGHWEEDDIEGNEEDRKTVVQYLDLAILYRERELGLW